MSYAICARCFACAELDHHFSRHVIGRRLQLRRPLKRTVPGGEDRLGAVDVLLELEERVARLARQREHRGEEDHHI